MTKEERELIKKRIALLEEEIFANEEENMMMESEIHQLYTELDKDNSND